MARTRDRLTPFVIYTNTKSAFITPDTLGGVWGEGEDPTADLLEQYGEDTEVVEISDKFMKAIGDDFEDEDDEDAEEFDAEVAA